MTPKQIVCVPGAHVRLNGPEAPCQCGALPPILSRKYDSTVARIAGNIMSGCPDIWDEDEYPPAIPRRYVTVAVALARLIVEETKATEPK